jgi:predicted alpha/beta hydrolase family esterase
LLVAHWAAATATAIRGALLVAVPDPAGPSFPVEATGFGTVPDAALRFPSVVVASTNDPYSSIQFAEYCAGRWGSRFINMGAAGHINSPSNLGEWPHGLALLQQLRDGG